MSEPVTGGSINGTDDGLRTIEDNVIPECRMKNAISTQDMVRRLIDDDEPRSRKRALVDGLVDGNPPYKAAKLRAAGRADAANFNAGTGRSYMESASGALYDLFSEAPGYVSVQTSHGNDEQKVEWSRSMSLEADVMFATDFNFNQDMQLSQLETTLHGTGPLFFENEHNVFPMSIETGDLLIPDRARSQLSRWELAAVLWNYHPPELYDFISNPPVSKQVGWRVGYTRKVIQTAMDEKTQDARNRNWEWYQTELKSNSFNYVSNATKVCKLAHVLWKEFDGKITHALVQREDTTAVGCEYLYFKLGRYNKFENVIHPMYVDRGRGGYHHTVTGLGVKMYSMMEYENRLLCNLMDKTFAPKIFFKLANGESKEKFQMVRYGDWGLVPAGTDFIQNPVQGFLTDGLAMFRTSSDLMRSNLSQYRQPVAQDKPGNPDTAFKEKMDAAEQGALSNTMFARYYAQMDCLYTEIIRRACNLNTTDDRAKEYQARCVKRGVPQECFGRVESVKAVRVVGQGSPFMRQQVLGALATVVQGNEDGLANWRDDVIAASAGHSAVQRYNPRRTQQTMASDQQFQATEAVAMAKIGIPAPITANQNPLIFATTFLKAATDALNSVRQGADPHEVLSFIQLCGQAIAAHLKRMEKDPLRKQAAEAIEQQLKKLGGLTDKLAKMVQQADQQRKAQQGKTQAAMTDQQIKAAKTRADLVLKKQKQDATLKMSADKHRLQLTQGIQNLQLNDARTANEIHNSKLKAFEE